MLFQGILDHGELSQEGRLVAAVTNNYSMVLAHDGDELFKSVFALIELTYLRRGVLEMHSDRK